MITIDNDQEFINRDEVYNSLVNGLCELVDDDLLPIKVTTITSSGISIIDANGESVDLSLDDTEMELEFQVLTQVVCSGSLSAPNLTIELIEDSDDDNQSYDSLYASNVYTTELGEVVYGSGASTDYPADASVDISSRWMLYSLLRDGIIEVVDSVPLDQLAVNTNITSVELGNMDQSFEAAPTSVSQLLARRKSTKRYARKLKLNRLKDPAASRKRSLAAKLRWRTNRSSYMHGIKKYHASAVGKRMHKLVGQANAVER